MSRIGSKEVMTEIYYKEIQVQQKLLDDAQQRVIEDHEGGKLSAKAFTCFEKALEMNKAAEASLKDEDFIKSLHFLIRSVANYYLMLGDKGVLRNG